MSYPSFPTDLATVLLSGYNVREPGLAGWWPLNMISEVPDGASPTYIRDPFANTTGWDPIGTGTLSVVGGKLTNTLTGTFLYFRLIAALGTGRTIRIKVTSPRSSEVKIFGTVDGVGNTLIAIFNIIANTPTVFDTYVAGNLTEVYYRQLVMQIGDVATMDWCYVGDGTYTTPAYDRSGLTANATLFGVTPATGKSGNGLILDGTNDYLLPALPPATYAALYLSAWVKLSAATSYCLFDPRNDAGVGGAQLMTDAVAYYVDGGSTLARIPYDGAWHHVVAPMTNIIVNKAWIGRTYAGASYLSGSLDELRFYTSLTEARRYDLYANPTTYAALPTYPLVDGYADSPTDNVILTDMATGPAKSRLRSTAAPRIINVQYHLNTAQKQILDQFYDSLGGVNPFYWTTPDTGEVLLVKFKPGQRPTYPIEGLGFRAMFAMEVVP